MVSDVQSRSRPGVGCELKVCRRRSLEAVQSSTEWDACTGEIDQVAGRKVGSEGKGDWPGPSN
jgi:hypothetical protein